MLNGIGPATVGRRSVAVVLCLLGLLAMLGACASGEKQFIVWPCNLLTPEDVKSASGVAVVEKDFSTDEVRAEGIKGDVHICQWNDSSSTDNVVEMQTVQTLDLFAAYSSLDGRSRDQALDGRDEPLVLDRLALDDEAIGQGETVIVADKGRSLAVQCRQPVGGNNWRSGGCTKLAKDAVGRIRDDDVDPDGKVAAKDACALLSDQDVRSLTGLADIASSGVRQADAAGKSGIANFECRWTRGGIQTDDEADALITVRAGLRIAEQCVETISGTGMFDEGRDSYSISSSSTVRLGAAKGEYCLHLLANTATIRLDRGDLTEAEAKKLFDGALKRLDAA